jgi:probable HAF family extracellular repeat protein
LILLFFSFSAAIAVAQTPRYTVHDLGTLGGSLSRATAINRFGQVVGSSTTASGQRHSFRTAANSSINIFTDDLGTLGGLETYATDINASGRAVGRSRLGTGAFHAFRTSPNAPIDAATDDLGTFGGLSSQAGGINDAGQVTGSADTTNGLLGRPHAFRTAPNRPIDSSAVDVGLLAPLSPFPGTVGTIVPTSGTRINNSGNIVGVIRYTDVGPGFLAGFVYKDGVFNLSNIPAGFGVDGAINDQNRAVLSQQGLIGVLWVNGVETEICLCFTLGINEPGQVVGGYSVPFGGECCTSALLYENGTLSNLNALIPANSGWTLQAATAINDRGQIAGFGVINGETHAFRLDPPMSPADLIAAEINLLTSFNLPAGTMNPAKAILSTALASFRQGNNEAARHQLSAFENVVRAESGKKLSADQANQLLAAAEQAVQLIQ